MIIVIIKFGELLLGISPRIIYQTLGRVFHVISKHLKVDFKSRRSVVFSNLFSVFGNWMKHSSSCLIYNNKHSQECFIRFSERLELV